MQSSRSSDIILDRGHYMAPDYNTYDLEDCLIGITSYTEKTKTGVWHSHKKPMVSFVLYGVNHEFREHYDTKRTTGSINFYHAYEPHKNVYTEFPSKHVSLEIDSLFLEKNNYTEDRIEEAIAHSYDAHFTFLKLLKEVSINDASSRTAIKMLVLDFFENSLHQKSQTYFPSWVQDISEILNDRWRETIALEELSMLVGVHPTTISKYFRAYFQCTYGTYTRKLKIDRALHKIKNSSLSLSAIAYECGFSDQSHFIRVFKDITGHLPNKYREL